MLKYLFIISLFFIAGCFKPIIRGYNFSPELETEMQIQAGMLREEIIEILSPPSFEIDNKMYYVSSVNKQRSFLPEKELSKTSLIITLSNHGQATDVKLRTYP